MNGITPYRATRLLYGMMILLALASQLPTQREAQAGPKLQEISQTQRQTFLPWVDSGTLPSSDQLIEAALQRGAITSEQALIYHTFAVFGDTRLPAAYRGNGTTRSEVGSTLTSRFDSLSTQAQETLAPFLAPPYYAGSWWDRQHAHQNRVAPSAGVWRCGMSGMMNDPLFDEWHYIDSPSGALRIWWQDRYPEDAAKAKALLPIADDAWLRLAALMQRTPPSDDGTKKVCRGDSDHYDISLVDLSNLGEAYTYETGNRASSSYILLNRATSPYAIIHELMHAFQSSFERAMDIEEYVWWREATANWAIDYVKPSLNLEHEYATYMLKEPEEKLEADTLWHHYGAYLFPQFLMMQGSKPDIIRQSFEQFATRNSLAGVDAVIPGGFKAQWPKFVLQMLNREPVNTFNKQDQLQTQVTLMANEAVTLNGAGDRTYEMNGEVKHLANHPYRYVFNDAMVRSVAFLNPLVENPQETARIQALVKIGGEWKQEDWTGQAVRSFCRDVKAERVEELIIVISNHEWQNRSHKLAFPKPPRLNISNVACRGWDFEMTATLEETGDQIFTEEQTVTTGRWERAPFASTGLYGQVFERYQAKNVKATWRHNGFFNTCKGSASGTVTVPGGEQTWLMVRNVALANTGLVYVAGERRYSGFGSYTTDSPTTKVMYTCPNSTYSFTPETLGLWFTTETEPTQSVSADGKQINGSFKVETVDANNEHRQVISYSWKMTALPPE